MTGRDSANVMEMGAGRRLALAAALVLAVWGCVFWAV